MPITTTVQINYTPPSDTIEQRRMAISDEIEAEFLKNNKDFEKLQKLVYNVVMLMMRRAAKADSEFVSEMSVQIKAQSRAIQDTYNTWPGLIITCLSSAVSLAGGAAGLAPLAPTWALDPAVGTQLGQAAMSIGNAGTGLSGIGSLVNNRQDGIRQVRQHELQRMQGKEDDRKGAKQNNNQTRRESKSALDNHLRDIHDIFMKMSGG